MIVVSPNLRIEFCVRCGVGLYVILNAADFHHSKPRPQTVPVSHTWTAEGEPLCWDCAEEIAIDLAEGRESGIPVTLPTLDLEYARVR